MTQPRPERGIHGYVVLTAFATLVLICIGGLVTSKGVGMAVPDWPTTYGYNMFFFPISQWVGGIFHEHLHRLVASGVGFLTVLLALALQWRDSRSWVRRLGWTALVLVIIQGTLGGLRVIRHQDSLLGAPAGVVFGVVHAATAQVFFCLVALLALWTSPAWHRWGVAAPAAGVRALDRKAGWIAILIFVQLMVAATMRHQHAGLAIPDFPLAYGCLYPPTDEAFITAVNQRRTDVIHEGEVTPFRVHLQMVHRFLAIGIVAHVLALAARMIRVGGGVASWGAVGGALILVQFALGAATVWTNKSADVATAHVAGGALSLVWSVLLTVSARRWGWNPGKVGACREGGSTLQAGAVAPNSGAFLS